MINYYKSNKFNVVLGIVKSNHSPSFNMAIKDDDDMIKIMNQSKNQINRRQDAEKCYRITNSMDVRGIVGDGASQRILQQIEMTQVDYLLALTKVDEVNLVAAKSAYEMGAKKIICRLRNTEYSHRNAIITPEQFGIDHVVYPEKAAKSDIENLIRQTSAIDLEEFNDGKINMVGIQLQHSSPLIGRNVRKVELSNPYVPHKLVLIIRENDSFIPKNSTTYKKDDIVFNGKNICEELMGFVNQKLGI
mgnify:CR=1 FL=1